MTSCNPRRIVCRLFFYAGLFVLFAAASASCTGQLGVRQLGAPLTQAVEPTGQSITRAATAPSTRTALPPIATASRSATLTAKAPSSSIALATASPQPTLASGAPILPATILPGPTALPVRIVISDLKIDARVVEMGWRAVDGPNGMQSEWIIPEFEAGHHMNSAPMGSLGNVVISGHNNIYGRVFEPISFAWDPDVSVRIDDVTLSSDALDGRRVEVHDALGRVYAYTIADFYLLRDTGIPLARRVENARFIQQSGRTQLTLVTCWPPTSNTHRLIVIAYPDGES